MADEIRNNHLGVYKQPYGPRRLCNCKRLCACQPGRIIQNPLHHTKKSKARPKVICHKCTFIIIVPWQHLLTLWLMSVPLHLVSVPVRGGVQHSLFRIECSIFVRNRERSFEPHRIFIACLGIIMTNCIYVLMQDTVEGTNMMKWATSRGVVHIADFYKFQNKWKWKFSSNSIQEKACSEKKN